MERRNMNRASEYLLQNELLNLHLIESEYVIKLKSATKTDNRYYMMIEYCNGGDLEGLMEAKGF